MKSEFERFQIMFNDLFWFTDRCLDRIPPDKLDWVPELGERVQYGDRVLIASIRNLYIHIISSEYDWVRKVRDCDDDTQIPPGGDRDLAKRMSEGDFRAMSQDAHNSNMEIVKGYTDEILEKSVRYEGWMCSGMGLLWGMYSHRAYHLGNIDLYMRQGDMNAPDFFTMEPTMMA